MRFSVLLAVLPFVATALAGPINKIPRGGDVDMPIGHHNPDPIEDDNRPKHDITQKPDLPIDIPEHLAKNPAVVEVLSLMKRQNFLDGCSGAPPPPPDCGPGKSGGAGCV